MGMIENAAEWLGHEVEALLATESGRNEDKELCIVSVVKEDGPKSFYRVKRRGEEPEDFAEWVEAVECYNDDTFSQKIGKPKYITFLKLGGMNGYCPKCNKMTSSLVNGEHKEHTKCRSCGMILKWK